MTELERALVALGRELDFPPTPDLAAGVRERLGRRRRWRPALVVLAVAAVAIGIAFAVPPARSAILRFLHLGTATIVRVETLLAAVDQLPEEQRSVVALRYFVGLSEVEVAETLGIPQGTVKSRTARALERLRESYD